jgi:hypothetical protein
MTGPFYRGVKRTFSAPVTGSPSSVTFTFRDPSGNESTIAGTLVGSSYELATPLTIDEGGWWHFKTRSFLAGDATNPVDSVWELFQVYSDPMTGV